MRNFVAAMLVWGITTSTLLFLPAPRNIPVALCKLDGTFYALEVGFETKDGSSLGEPKTDSLLLAGGILALVSTFFCFSWFVVQQGRRGSLRAAMYYIVAPVFAMAVATLCLFLLAAHRSGGCTLASGAFVKLAEVAGIAILLFGPNDSTAPSAPPQKVKTSPIRKPAPADVWDPSSVSLGFK